MDDSKSEDDLTAKDQLLNRIKRLASRGLITRSEVLEAYREGEKRGDGPGDALAIREDHPDSERVSRAFYSIGALIVFLGIALLVFQHWTALSGFSKVMLTLGFGSSVLAAAVVLDTLGFADVLARASYYLSGLILPLGLFITYHVNGLNPYSPGIVTQVTGLLLLVYLGLFQWYDRTVVLVYAIVFGSACYFGLTEWIIETGDQFTRVRFYHYRTLFASVAWMILARMTRRRERPVLKEVLWGVGNLAFLSAGYALGGWEAGRYVLWELMFPFMVLLIFGISLRTRSRISLVFSSLFLVAYLIRLTMKYFHESFGWPLALVLLGFGIMSIGSVTYLVYDRLLLERES